MQINTKFNLNDVVYVIDSRKIMNKNCSFCGGVGKIEVTGLNGGIAFGKCPQCNGTGNIKSNGGIAWSSKTEYYIRNSYPISMVKMEENVSFEISSITINDRGVLYNCRVLDKNGQVLKEKAFPTTEDKLYSSREACQKWCDDMNALQQYS